MVAHIRVSNLAEKTQIIIDQRREIDTLKIKPKRKRKVVKKVVQ